jgi:hypothetical protein
MNLLLLVVVVLILLLSPSSSAVVVGQSDGGQNIRIVDSSPVDGTIVKRGRSVRLSCRTDVRW